MKLLQRLRNLWAWSALEPTTPQAAAFIPKKQQASIISLENPVNEIYEAIRKENSGEA